MQLHTANAEIQFSSDGKFANSVRSRSRATKYKDAANLQEYFNSGATVSDYRNDVSRGVFHFRDTQLWDLQANSAANWSTLGSGGEEVTRDYFRNFMLSFTNRSQRWTKSDHLGCTHIAAPYFLQPSTLPKSLSPPRFRLP